MRIGKSILIALAFGVVAPAYVFADDYVDDIYFNPNKDKTVGAVKKNPNYIENFSDMDVDAYNLRGQYYSSPVDTIGAGISADEDFVYTQQIQKYYNPTIVLDNEELLADVLENSYGNVEIVYNGLTPAFLPVYGYGWPYYRSYYNPWAWNIGWGWYDPWYYGPSWSWSWGWGPSWTWGWSWGPSWGWGGPALGGPGIGRPHSTWNPGGNRPNRPGVGWAGAGHSTANRPSARPGNTHSASQWSIGGNHRTGGYVQNSGNGIQHASGNGGNSGYTIGNGGHRYRGTSTVSNSSSSSSGNQRSGSTYNSTTRSNSSKSSTSTNRSSYNNSSRSSGNGSFGSGSFGGSHRSSGGGSRSGGGSSRGSRR